MKTIRIAKFSLGIASVAEDARTGPALSELADKRMYEMKKARKERAETLS